MNSTLTLSAKTATFGDTATISTIPAVGTRRPKPLTAAQLRRTLVRKWDMLAVIGLMASSAAYGIFALAHVA